MATKRNTSIDFAIVFFLTLIQMSLAANAQTPSQELEISNAAVKAVEDLENGESQRDVQRDTRHPEPLTQTGGRPFFVMGEYAPFDLLVPGKFGLGAGIAGMESSTYEVEFLRGSFGVPLILDDIGGMSDTRVSLLKRSNIGSGSFQFHYGLSYFAFELKVGSSILERATSGQVARFDAVRVDQLGLVVGIGNRWAIGKSFIIGVDWLSWAQPLLILKEESEILRHLSNEGDKREIEKAIRIISFVPRFSVLKLNLGYLF